VSVYDVTQADGLPLLNRWKQGKEKDTEYAKAHLEHADIRTLPAVLEEGPLRITSYPPASDLSFVPLHRGRVTGRRLEYNEM
jgi:hypothetical protein